MHVHPGVYSCRNAGSGGFDARSKEDELDGIHLLEFFADCACARSDFVMQERWRY